MHHRAAGFSCSLFLLLAVTAGAQTAPEARSVLADIERWLPGTWDNEPQLFFENGMGTEAAGRRTVMQLAVEQNDGDAGDLLTISGTKRVKGGDPMLLQLTFSIDDDSKTVRQDTRGSDGDSPCPVWWQRGAGGIIGLSAEEDSADCALASADVEWQLAEDSLVRTGGEGDSRHLARFSKVRWYECFALLQKPDGSGITMQNPFTLHDGGDVYRFTTDEAEPRQIEVLLRRSMWPSRSGNNFVPLLQLNVYENGDFETPLANAWSAADSGRVGFAARDVGSARCKLSDQAAGEQGID